MLSWTSSFDLTWKVGTYSQRFHPIYWSQSVNLPQNLPRSQSSPKCMASLEHPVLNLEELPGIEQEGERHVTNNAVDTGSCITLTFYQLSTVVLSSKQCIFFALILAAFLILWSQITWCVFTHNQRRQHRHENFSEMISLTPTTLKYSCTVHKYQYRWRDSHLFDNVI